MKTPNQEASLEKRLNEREMEVENVIETFPRFLKKDALFCERDVQNSPQEGDSGDLHFIVCFFNQKKIPYKKLAPITFSLTTYSGCTHSVVTSIQFVR